MAYDLVTVMREARKRRRKALRLLKQGKTQQEIADIFGVTKQRASEIIARAKRENGVA